MNKKKITSLLLLMAMSVSLVQCGQVNSSSEDKSNISVGEEIINETENEEEMENESEHKKEIIKEPMDKEEFFLKVKPDLDIFGEIAKKHQVGGVEVEERIDESSYGIYFDSFVEVASSKKPIEDGTVYYLFSENEEGQITESSFKYYVGAMMQTDTFNFDMYPTIKEHLEKIKETEPNLNLDKIVEIINSATDTGEDVTFFDSDKDDSMNLQNGYLSISFGENYDGVRGVYIEYTITADWESGIIIL